MSSRSLLPPALLRHLYLYEFVPELLHDLNNECTVLGGAAILLKGNSRDEAGTIDRAQYIQRSADRIESITWAIDVINTALGGPRSFRSNDDSLLLFLQIAGSIVQRRMWNFSVEYEPGAESPAPDISLALACAVRAVTSDRGVVVKYQKDGELLSLSVEGARPGDDWPEIETYLSKGFSIAIRKLTKDGILQFAAPRPT
ncbi:MAG: hypothetical protein ACKVS6_17240 [Planctomycetota bacterium]